MNVNKSWWTPLFGKANILPKSARHAFSAAGFEIAGWEILNKRRNILTTKKFKKVSIVLVTLLAVLLSLLSLVACAAEDNMDGMYYPTDETTTNPGSWIYVDKDAKTVELYHVPFSVPNESGSTPYKDFSVVDKVFTFTYSTTKVEDKEKKYGESYYPVYIDVNGYTISAKYYYNSKTDVKIVYQRMKLNTDIPYDVVYAK